MPDLDTFKALRSAGVLSIPCIHVPIAFSSSPGAARAVVGRYWDAARELSPSDQSTELHAIKARLDKLRPRMDADSSTIIFFREFRQGGVSRAKDALHDRFGPVAWIDERVSALHSKKEWAPDLITSAKRRRKQDIRTRDLLEMRQEILRGVSELRAECGYVPTWAQIQGTGEESKMYDLLGTVPTWGDNNRPNSLPNVLEGKRGRIDHARAVKEWYEDMDNDLPNSIAKLQARIFGAGNEIGSLQNLISQNGLTDRYDDPVGFCELLGDLVNLYDTSQTESVNAER